MKAIHFFSTLAVLFSLTFLLQSCAEDPCEAVVCQNGGTCNEGVCDCPDGFSGANCEIHPCDAEGHIVDTWNITNYLGIVLNEDGTESATYTGSSGTAVFNSDGTGSINAPTSVGTIDQNITYTTETVGGVRKLNIIYAVEPNKTYSFSLEECSQNQVSMTATVDWSGSQTFTETYGFSRQQ